MLLLQRFSIRRLNAGAGIGLTHDDSASTWNRMRFSMASGSVNNSEANSRTSLATSDVDAASVLSDEKIEELLSPMREKQKDAPKEEVKSEELSEGDEEVGV